MTPFVFPTDVVQIIQLAVAPVFLIAGIGALLNVMTARLARVIDRSRVLEDVLREKAQSPAREARLAELRSLDQRMKRINWAISLATLATLLVCLVIVTLFASELIAMNMGRLLALLFIAAMLALIASLVLFFMEISIATKTLRISREYRSRPRFTIRRD